MARTDIDDAVEVKILDHTLPLVERIAELERGAHTHLSEGYTVEEYEEIPSRSGEYWSSEEDRALDDELTRALNWMARKHRRTSNAIQCRINMRGLI